MATRDTLVRPFLFDTMVFVYAVGSEHPLKAPCRGILDRAGRGELIGQASVMVPLEFAHQRARRTGDRREAFALAQEIGALCRLLDVTADDLERAIELGGRHDGLDATDALYAATALNREIGTILSSDRGFDGVPGLNRVDPADASAVAGLAD